jgi:hypothetical protein
MFLHILMVLLYPRFWGCKYLIYNGLGQTDPKPETRNPKPETRNPKPETRNPKPETRNPKPETRNPKPETRNSKLQTRNCTSFLAEQPQELQDKTLELAGVGKPFFGFGGDLAAVHLLVQVAHLFVDHFAHG